MFATRCNRGRSTVLRLIQKHILKRQFSTIGSAPTQFDEKKSDLGPTTKSRKPPFLKNVLLGRFDKDLLLYPEVVDLEQLQQFAIDNVSIEVNEGNRNVVPQQTVRDKVKSLLKSNLPLGPNETCNESERMKICELLDLDLQTALVMETQSMVIRIISKFGNDRVKAKYLPKLQTGEWTGAFAMSESTTGSDPSALMTNAILDDTQDVYKLDGTKEWIANGIHADVFIVLATTPAPHGMQHSDVNAFVVERQSIGVSTTAQTTYELRDCGIAQVRLENTPVPSENILGEYGTGLNVATTCITHDRFFVMTSLLNAMKKAFNEVVEIVRTRRQSTVALKDCELIQLKFSKIGSTIYAVESMLYWYAGMIDMYDMDVTIESAALQSFCFDAASESLKLCNEILGGQSYDGNSHHMQLLNEIQGVILASKTQTLLQLFVGMMGLQYAGLEMQKIVKMNRNPLDFPGFIIKRMISRSRQDRDNPIMGLNLYMELHPSLKSATDNLEYAVVRVPWAVESILSRYGSDSLQKQVDVIRLSDVLINVLMMTAVVSRASRSYCTGIRFSDQETFIANAICYLANHRVRQMISEIVDGGNVSCDLLQLKVGVELINQGGYFIEHPLVRNIK